MLKAYAMIILNSAYVSLRSLGVNICSQISLFAKNMYTATLFELCNITWDLQPHIIYIHGHDIDNFLILHEPST